ncbi:von Willebrand factor type A domain protein [Desulfosarcina variabilis str. Montpellier]|uniref:vWA domain-containing protein n=1 Tax=Desulfosarcina variabilis TaxID=2300 RepID=UPI003AFA98F8
MSRKTKHLITILGLIALTTGVLTVLNVMGSQATVSPTSPQYTTGSGLTVSSEVVQEKILKHGDGHATVALSLTAHRLPDQGDAPPPPADVVIVLDRSGSMEGQKLADACQAVLDLIEQLSPNDRLALVAYSDGVQTLAPLLPITADNHRHLVSLTRKIVSGGGTNLGGGLRQGIDLMLEMPGKARQRKVILISDGLANQGITDPSPLGQMAGLAVEHHFTVSTVGVGLDFNETLMTTIADHGAGSYHFLEDPRSFAQVFKSELSASRRVAVSDLEIRMPLSTGVILADAGGYPVRHEKGVAVVHPGDLLSGQQRTIFLTFRVPTDTLGTIPMGRLAMQYRFANQPQRIETPKPPTVLCVADPAAAMASINKKVWTDQVVKDEFGQLKENVAKDIRDGKKSRAQQRIREYEAKQAAINRVVGSCKVTQNLTTDVKVLRDQVEETFAGPPAVTAEKKKRVSKSLQYDSYKSRRDK